MQHGISSWGGVVPSTKIFHLSLMSACLRIGNFELTGEQVFAALTRYQLIESFVSQVVLDSVFLKDIRLTKEEVYCSLVGAGDDTEIENVDVRLEDWLQRNQVPQVYLELVICRQLRVEKLKRFKFDSSLESEFLRCKAEFDQVEFSLIQISDRVLADELYFQLRDGESEFAVLAQQYSEGFERQTQGWVGPVKLSTLPKAVIQGFDESQIGIIQKPEAVGARFWIVRLERFLPTRLTEAVRTELREKLFSLWLKSLARSVMSKPGQVQVINAAAVEQISQSAA